MLPRRVGPLTSSVRVPRTWKASAPFLLANLAPLLVVFTGVTRRALILGAVLYVTRMFFIDRRAHV